MKKTGYGLQKYVQYTYVKMSSYNTDHVQGIYTMEIKHKNRDGVWEELSRGWIIHCIPI